MQYKIIFDDFLNKLRVIPISVYSPNYVALNPTFNSESSANKFIKLVDSLFMASWARDLKMGVRVFNRMWSYKL